MEPSHLKPREKLMIPRTIIKQGMLDVKGEATVFGNKPWKGKYVVIVNDDATLRLYNTEVEFKADSGAPYRTFDLRKLTDVVLLEGSESTGKHPFRLDLQFGSSLTTLSVDAKTEPNQNDWLTAVIGGSPAYAALLGMPCTAGQAEDELQGAAAATVANAKSAAFKASQDAENASSLAAARAAAAKARAAAAATAEEEAARERAVATERKVKADAEAAAASEAIAAADRARAMDAARAAAEEAQARAAARAQEAQGALRTEEAMVVQATAVQTAVTDAMRALAMAMTTTTGTLEERVNSELAAIRTALSSEAQAASLVQGEIAALKDALQSGLAALDEEHKAARASALEDIQSKLVLSAVQTGIAVKTISDNSAEQAVNKAIEEFRLSTHKLMDASFVAIEAKIDASLAAAASWKANFESRLDETERKLASAVAELSSKEEARAREEAAVEGNAQEAAKERIKELAGQVEALTDKLAALTVLVPVAADTANNERDEFITPAMLKSAIAEAISSTPAAPAIVISDTSKPAEEESRSAAALASQLSATEARVNEALRGLSSRMEKQQSSREAKAETRLEELTGGVAALGARLSKVAEGGISDMRHSLGSLVQSVSSLQDKVARIEGKGAGEGDGTPSDGKPYAQEARVEAVVEAARRREEQAQQHATLASTVASLEQQVKLLAELSTTQQETIRSLLESAHAGLALQSSPTRSQAVHKDSPIESHRRASLTLSGSSLLSPVPMTGMSRAGDRDSTAEEAVRSHLDGFGAEVAASPLHPSTHAGIEAPVSRGKAMRTAWLASAASEQGHE